MDNNLGGKLAKFPKRKDDDAIKVCSLFMML